MKTSDRTGTSTAARTVGSIAGSSVMVLAIWIGSLPAAGASLSDPGGCVGESPRAVASPPIGAETPGHDGVSTETVPVPFATLATPDRIERLGGRWRQIAKPPFAVQQPASVWTGDRLLAVDPEERRTAAYDPATDTWTEQSRAPMALDVDEFGPPVWTGEEMILVRLVSSADDEGLLSGLGFDPRTDTWRQLPEVNADPPNPWEPVEDRTVNDAVWTGERVIVVTSNRVVAAYDPGADCWESLPPVPGQRSAWHVYWTGETVLAETRGVGGIAVSMLDPTTGTWQEPSLGPLDRWAARGGARWVGDELAFVTWNPEGLEDRPNAIYDPADGSWEVFDHECTDGSGSGSLQAGPLLVDGQGREALDPATGDCYHLPERDPLLLGGGLAWTGRHLISWSGVPGDAGPPQRTGFRYRLPLDP